MCNSIKIYALNIQTISSAKPDTLRASVKVPYDLVNAFFVVTLLPSLRLPTVDEVTTFTRLY